MTFCAILVSVTAYAQTVLNPDHPDRYVVVEGDTLWDISARFLRDPWLWPNIWHANQEIANPHLIYPGDTLNLVYVDGQPRLMVERGAPSSTVKLTPQGRVIPLSKAIPSIPLDAIGPFLNRPLVTSDEELDAAPYVVQSADEHVITGAGDRIYVRKLTTEETSTYSVVRKGQVFVDPKTQEILGTEAIYVGTAKLQSSGDPSTLWLSRTSREVLVGDRLLPDDESSTHEAFQPHAPRKKIEGQIIAVADGVSQIGLHQVVIINKGARDGMDQGHVLAIFQKGATVLDAVTEDRNDTVTLPDERAGELMIFRTFEKVSYGLVMRSSRNMNVLDLVRNP